MFEFYTRVPKAGFEWLLTKTPFASKAGRFLIDRSPVGELADYRNFPPLAESGLFQAFAEVPKNEEGVLSFANRFGMLDNLQNRVAVLRPAGRANTFDTVPGERLAFWLAEIDSMAHAIQLLNATRRKDAKCLAKFVRWHGVQAVTYASPSGNLIPLASPKHSPELMSLFQNGDVILPARHAIHLLVNEKIKQHGATPRLFSDCREHRPTPFAERTPPSRPAGTCRR